MCLLDISLILLGSGSNTINKITIEQTARAVRSVKQYLSNIYISSFESNDRYCINDTYYTDDEYEISSTGGAEIDSLETERDKRPEESLYQIMSMLYVKTTYLIPTGSCLPCRTVVVSFDQIASKHFWWLKSVYMYLSELFKIITL